MKKKCHNLIRIGFYLIMAGLSVAMVSAQVVIPTGDGKDPIVIDTFGPTVLTDLRKYGVLPFIGYLGILFIGFIILMVIIYMSITAIKIISGAGDTGEQEKGLKTIGGFIKGIFVSFGFLIFYGVFSIWLGIGNMFLWPSKLAQCGDGEFLFRAEYRAQTVNKKIFDDQVLIYCCEKFEIFLDEGESEKSVDNKNFNNRDNALVGDPEKGGWLFIADIRDNTKNIIPANIQDATGCQPFTLDRNTGEALGM